MTTRRNDDMGGAKKSPRLTDILSGILAVLSLPTSMLTRHRRSKKDPTTPPVSHQLTELTILSQKIAAHALRLKINELVTQARTLLNYLQIQPDSAPPWQDAVQDCLTSAITGTRRFASLTPHITDPTDPRIIKFGHFLSSITQILTDMREKLNGKDGCGLSSEVGVYQNALDSIIQIQQDAGKSA